MCELSPVRKVLERFPLSAVESARDTALERHRNARNAGDKANADLFRRVAQECSEELEDRLLAIAARDVLRESSEADRQAAALMKQMING
jgi:hypothetical protein